MDQQTGYAMPLDLDHFFKTRQFKATGLQGSIQEHIHLLLITGHGEFGFDREFGCDLWDHEFETQSGSGVWVDRIAESIRERLEFYEKRLTNLEVKAELTQAEFATKEGELIARRLKRKVTVGVTARLASTSEVFRFEDSILLSPFSLD